jgi:hypothetical protein
VHDGAWLLLWFLFERFDFADEQGERTRTLSVVMNSAMGWLQHELSVWFLVLASVFAGSASSKHQLLGVGSNSSLAAPS